MKKTREEVRATLDELSMKTTNRNALLPIFDVLLDALEDAGAFKDFVPDQQTTKPGLSSSDK